MAQSEDYQAIDSPVPISAQLYFFPLIPFNKHTEHVENISQVDGH